MKALTQHLVGFQNNHEGLVVDLLHRLLDQIHLLIVAGAHNHLLILLPVAAAGMKNRRATAGPLVDDLPFPAP